MGRHQLDPNYPSRSQWDTRWTASAEMSHGLVVQAFARMSVALVVPAFAGMSHGLLLFAFVQKSHRLRVGLYFLGLLVLAMLVCRHVLSIRRHC